MDPARKRTIRLVVALSCALLLASALVYTSFSAVERGTRAQPARPPPRPGVSYQLTGKVEKGSTRTRARCTRSASGPRRQRVGAGALLGRVPDPFREGREVIVTVRKQGDVFVGEPDSLITKCPSKFEADTTADLSPVC